MKMTRLDRVRRVARGWLRYPAFLRARWQDERLKAKVHHGLAVCAIFREEAPFLEEWLRFHEGVGATKFYLYNNFSTDSYAEVLAPFVARGVVELTDWPLPAGQLAAYRDCLGRHGEEARWIAFLDIDEFLFSPASRDIRSVLREFADLPGVLVYSAFFGSNGHMHRPQSPLIEACTRRAPFSQFSAKCIVNPRHVYKVGIHISKYWHGEALDTARRVLAPENLPVWDRLRINHYWSRSLEDLEKKSHAATPPLPPRATPRGTAPTNPASTPRKIG